MGTSMTDRTSGPETAIIESDSVFGVWLLTDRYRSLPTPHPLCPYLGTLRSSWLLGLWETHAVSGSFILTLPPITIKTPSQAPSPAPSIHFGSKSPIVWVQTFSTCVCVCMSIISLNIWTNFWVEIPPVSAVTPIITKDRRQAPCSTGMACWHF